MECSVSDLVKRGHEQAAELKSSCGAIDVRSVAQLISDLATQLEVQFVRSTKMAVQLANAESKCRELATVVAENVALKSALNDILQPDAAVLERNHRVRALDAMETPATDVFLAEVRASARNEGINYAASRLAAAFNHGFLDKPVSEVLDVTRMILSAKEDLANDPLPADDGLSGEYAEKAIEEWADQLRKGV
ncbi:hypothetical protein DO628_12430, partial [Salmonella enterica subsp. salamae]|nr:hypothetical protein [Salmonella enterica subsp. salamae serovar Sofia]